MTKLEECARALLDLECEPTAAKTGYGKFWGWDDAHPVVKAKHIEQARAVLLALREPDEGMVQAGEAVAVQPFVPAGQFLPMTFAAMIDAVLDNKD